VMAGSCGDDEEKPLSKRAKVSSSGSAVAVDEGKLYQLWGSSYTKSERSSFQLDGTAVYSVTDARTADRIAKVVGALAGAPFRHVCDGCACVGGNALSFGRNLREATVTAVELDGTRFEMLRHNAGVAKLEIRCVQGDFAALLGAAEDDDRTTLRDVEVLFLDPPWGGKAVDDAPLGTVELRLGGLGLHEICRRVAKEPFQVRHVLFKLPPSYNFDKLQADLGSDDFDVTLERSFRKMVLVVVSLKHRNRQEGDDDHHNAPPPDEGGEGGDEGASSERDCQSP